ncbi:MAG TPA: GNAT family N-acetyltransferase [Rhizomicrobium sp.]|jgi:ribosomal-protein-alanine N-acetyltransferase
MTVQYRFGTLADLAAIAGLHAVCFADAWDEEFFGRLLAQPGAFSLVAREDGTPAGFVAARAVAGEAEILSLGVPENFRRRGIGSELTARAVRRAAAMGASSLCLEVAVENHTARALYERLGFRQAGSRPAYYKDIDGVLRGGLILKCPLGEFMGKEPETD